MLVKNEQANGFADVAWTLRRIGHLVEQEFGTAYGKINIWLLLKGSNDVFLPASCRTLITSKMEKRYGNGDSNAGRCSKSTPEEKNTVFHRREPLE